jgi:hypothetical protein
MLPKAYVSPAQMRATRDLLRRRTPLMRKRAELLSHVHNTNAQYHLPERGKKIAYKANRAGVAEHFNDPAVHKTIEVDLALITYYDALLKDLELYIVKTAKQHAAHTLYLLQTVPGIGKILRLVLLYAIHQIDAFHAGRISPRTHAWSKAGKNRPANAWGPPAKKSATRPSHGPFPKPLPCACVTILRLRSSWHAWRKNMPRVKRLASWRIN